jgi:hypothetical protein
LGLISGGPESCVYPIFYEHPIRSARTARRARPPHDGDVPAERRYLAYENANTEACSKVSKAPFVLEGRCARRPFLLINDMARVVKLIRQNSVATLNAPASCGVKSDHASIRPKHGVRVKTGVGYVPADDVQVIASWIPQALVEIEDEVIDIRQHACIVAASKMIVQAGARIMRPDPVDAGGAMERVEPHHEQRRDWVMKRHLSTDALKEYVARLGIERAQVIAVTEPQDGSFTLIFEPTDQQTGLLEADEEQVAEVLDELFGTPITPVLTPSGEEVGSVVAVPMPATPDPIPETPDPVPS